MQRKRLQAEAVEGSARHKLYKKNKAIVLNSSIHAEYNSKRPLGKNDCIIHGKTSNKLEYMPKRKFTYNVSPAIEVYIKN